MEAIDSQLDAVNNVWVCRDGVVSLALVSPQVPPGYLGGKLRLLSNTFCCSGSFLSLPKARFEVWPSRPVQVHATNNIFVNAFGGPRAATLLSHHPNSLVYGALVWHGAYNAYHHVNDYRRLSGQDNSSRSTFQNWRRLWGMANTVQTLKPGAPYFFTAKYRRPTVWNVLPEDFALTVNCRARLQGLNWDLQGADVSQIVHLPKEYSEEAPSDKDRTERRQNF